MNAVKGGVVRNVLVLCSVTALLLLISVAGASADTWSGQCTLKGTSYYQTPYTVVPRYNGFVGVASGTCKGTLNGASYNGPASLYMDGRMQRIMSCETGASASVTGLASRLPGTLSFGDPSNLNTPQVGVLLDEAHLMTEMPIHYSGSYNGDGVAHLQYNGDLAALESCISGPGLSHLDFSMTMLTLSELYG